MLRPAINQNDHAEGPADATIHLVEYGDYQCPHCGRAYPVIKDIKQQMGERLQFVFRNFPLNEIHPQAFMAAVATEAAARQNKFWQMHDVVFENQQQLSFNNLLQYAEELDLNTEQFEADMNDEQLKQKVEADFESGVLSGVNGTPTFFINGKRYNGSWEEEELLDVLTEIANR